MRYFIKFEFDRSLIFFMTEFFKKTELHQLTQTAICDKESPMGYLHCMFYAIDLMQNT